VPETRAASSHPAVSHAARPLRLDPILDQLAQGHSQPAKAGMPLILNRLMPLLRLLSAKQRDQLVRFLQELQGP